MTKIRGIPKFISQFLILLCSFLPVLAFAEQSRCQDSLSATAAETFERITDARDRVLLQTKDIVKTSVHLRVRKYQQSWRSVDFMETLFGVVGNNPVIEIRGYKIYYTNPLTGFRIVEDPIGKYIRIAKVNVEPEKAPIAVPLTRKEYLLIDRKGQYQRQNEQVNRTSFEQLSHLDYSKPANFHLRLERFGLGYAANQKFNLDIDPHNPTELISALNGVYLRRDQSNVSLLKKWKAEIEEKLFHIPRKELFGNSQETHLGVYSLQAIDFVLKTLDAEYNTQDVLLEFKDKYNSLEIQHH